jgi:hypothetical protein
LGYLKGLNRPSPPQKCIPDTREISSAMRACMALTAHASGSHVPVEPLSQVDRRAAGFRLPMLLPPHVLTAPLILCKSQVARPSTPLHSPLRAPLSTERRHREPSGLVSLSCRPHAPTVPPSRSPIFEPSSTMRRPRSTIASSTPSTMKMSLAQAALSHGPPPPSPPRAPPQPGAPHRPINHRRRPPDPTVPLPAESRCHGEPLSGERGGQHS